MRAMCIRLKPCRNSNQPSASHRAENRHCLILVTFSPRPLAACPASTRTKAPSTLPAKSVLSAIKDHSGPELIRASGTVLAMLNATDRRREDVSQTVTAFSRGWADKIGRLEADSASDWWSVVRGATLLAGLSTKCFCEAYLRVFSPDDIDVCGICEFKS